MLVYEQLLFLDYVVNDKGISNVVLEAHPEHPYNQLKELIIILFADAII